MHRNIYTVNFAAVAVAAVQDLFTLITAASSRIAICRAEVMQHSDFGDAASEILAYRFVRSTAVAPGSVGTAPTPVNLKGHTGAKAAVTTARVNDTTQAVGGTLSVLYASAFNIAAGLLYAPRYGGDQDIDERITVEASSRLVLSLDSVPADSLTCSGTLTFEELGLN